MSGFVLITRHPSECRGLQSLLDPCGLKLRPYPVLRLSDVHDEKGWKTVMERVPETTIIPEQALTLRDDRKGVFMVSEDGQTAVWREVKAGIREGGRVQVEGEGLSGRVIILGQQQVKNGSAIIIPAEEGAPTAGDGKGGAK